MIILCPTSSVWGWAVLTLSRPTTTQILTSSLATMLKITGEEVYTKHCWIRESSKQMRKPKIGSAIALLQVSYWHTFGERYEFPWSSNATVTSLQLSQVYGLLDRL